MLGHVVDELAAFAEDQLAATARARVSRHLASCAECRLALEEVRRGIALASGLIAEPMPADVAARIRRQLESAVVLPTRTGARAAGFGWWQAAAALLVTAASLAFYWQVNRPWVRLEAASQLPTPFEREGRELHDRLAAGSTPLAFRSGDERELWRWLAAQGAPITSMRVERSASEQAEFVPLGASVQTLDGARTSVLAYRIDGHPVTLALAHTDSVHDAPKAGLLTKRVMHRRDASGRNTLTWTVGDGTYVMVSELDGAGQRACLICHTSEPFRRRIHDLAVGQ